MKNEQSIKLICTFVDHNEKKSTLSRIGKTTKDGKNMTFISNSGKEYVDEELEVGQVYSLKQQFQIG